MTLLDRELVGHEPEEGFEQLVGEILSGYDGQTVQQRRISAEQILFFVEKVQPGLQHQDHLAYMALNHSNIVLGQE